jgi:hypothetical protein
MESNDAAQPERVRRINNLVRGPVGFSMLSIEKDNSGGGIVPRIYLESLFVFSMVFLYSALETKQIIKVCQFCGTAFQPKPKAKKGTRFCSDDCRKNQHRIDKRKFA